MLFCTLKQFFQVRLLCVCCTCKYLHNLLRIVLKLDSCGTPGPVCLYLKLHLPGCKHNRLSNRICYGSKPGHRGQDTLRHEQIPIALLACGQETNNFDAQATPVSMLKMGAACGNGS